MAVLHFFLVNSPLIYILSSLVIRNSFAKQCNRPSHVSPASFPFPLFLFPDADPVNHLINFTVQNYQIVYWFIFIIQDYCKKFSLLIIRKGIYEIKTLYIQDVPGNMIVGRRLEGHIKQKLSINLYFSLYSRNLLYNLLCNYEQIKINCCNYFHNEKLQHFHVKGFVSMISSDPPATVCDKQKSWLFKNAKKISDIDHIIRTDLRN